MDNVRFFGLAVGMFAAVFFGMKWFLTVQPLQPDARIPTFQPADPDSPRSQLMASSISDNDATRDRLRNAVLEDSRALYDDPCNDNLKARYIKAVNDYARAWLSIVPCLTTRTCRNADSLNIERAAEAFGTPSDHRVREAMQQVHAKGVFKLGDFPNDTARMVAELAADGAINPAAARPTTNGPVNAQNDPRPHPGFDEVSARLATHQDVCG
jgi:hypothetical protein